MPVIHRVRVDFNIPGPPTQPRNREEKIPPYEKYMNNHKFTLKVGVENRAQIARNSPNLPVHNNFDENSGLCRIYI